METRSGGLKLTRFFLLTSSEVELMETFAGGKEEGIEEKKLLTSSEVELMETFQLKTLRIAGFQYF